MLINALINTQKVTHAVQIHSHNPSDEYETPRYAAMLACCINTMVSDLSLVMDNITSSSVVIQNKFDCWSNISLPVPSCLPIPVNWA